jgi:hypothetical protein
MGVRISSSWPRGAIEQLSVEFSAKDAGRNGVDGDAFFDHSTASERVRDATPALLAA